MVYSFLEYNLLSGEVHNFDFNYNGISLISWPLTVTKYTHSRSVDERAMNSLYTSEKHFLSLLLTT